MQHNPCSIQIDDINGIAHKPRMNAVAGFEPETGIGREAGTTDEPDAALPDALPHLETFQYNPPRIRFTKAAGFSAVEGVRNPASQHTLDSGTALPPVIVMVNCSGHPAILRDRLHT